MTSGSVEHDGEFFKAAENGNDHDINCADQELLKEAEEETAPSEPSPPEVLMVSHFRNVESHPAYVRYGIPLFLLCTLVLRINADATNRVSAEYILLRDGEIVEQKELLLVSVFSSVRELWGSKSYPLAILIVLTSILWPYVRLLLSFYAWFTPYKNPRRRESLIKILDAFGKWSFADIVVLVQIMVAFRSSVQLALRVSLEIVLLAKWGLIGFLLATIMSLVSTHIILYGHRKVHYHSNPGSDTSEDHGHVGLKARGGVSTTFVGVAGLLVLLSIALYIVGCIVDIFQVISTRGEVSFSVDYSITSVGMGLPDSQEDANNAGTRFIQFMWFFLCVAMPLWCTFLFGVLFFYPFSRKWLENVFFMAEFAFAWSCAEVLMVSTIFAVLQMPNFGDGLIEADCSSCFVVETSIRPNFAFLCIGSLLSVATNYWLYRKAYGIIYDARHG